VALGMSLNVILSIFLHIPLRFCLKFISLQFKYIYMRKIAAILLVLFTMSLCFDSCTKYENGPAFSFLSPKKRAIGEWHLADLLVNDTREQSLFEREALSVLTLGEDDTFSYNIQIVRSLGGITGQWSFGEDKTELILTTTELDERVYRITRLTKDEMWLVSDSKDYVGFDDLIERHFEKKEE